MTRTRIEWVKRLIILPVMIMVALALREWALTLGLSRWIVTLISPALYVLCFWLADITGRPWTHD